MPESELNEAKVTWLIVIVEKQLGILKEFKLKPLLQKQYGGIIILQYFATAQEINKMSSGLMGTLAMRLPSDRNVLMIIDSQGILWNYQNNKITNLRRSET